MHRTLSVLLVEDNPGDFRLIREMLCASVDPPFRVIGAASLGRAVAVLETEQVSAILLDLSLPDSRGLDTVRGIVQGAPDQPILVLTGLQDERLALEAVQAGAQDYLIKGEVTATLLIRSIRYSLERKRVENNLRVQSEMNDLLTSALDHGETVRRVTALLVPRLADLCIVDLLAPDGSARRLEVGSAEGVDDALAGALLECPLDRGRDHLAWRALEQRRPELVVEVPVDHTEIDERHRRHLEFCKQLEVQSCIVAPLLAGDRVLGALTLLTTAASGRSYGTEDLALFQDLASRAALVMDNARLYGEARDALRARDEMLMIVSHDLRNPLHAITLGTSIARRRIAARTGEPLPELNEVEEIAMQMDSFIQDLLDVTRLDAGHLPIRPAPVCVRDLLETARDRHLILADAEGVEFTVSLPENASTVMADRARILQVLANLLGNAIGFTERGGRVRLQTEALKDDVLFVVRDTGAGIPPANISRLFERFWKGGKTNSGGVGLGLSIVKGIVELHGGSVHVESELGHGSAFSFTLPRVPGSPEASGG